MEICLPPHTIYSVFTTFLLRSFTKNENAPLCIKSLSGKAGLKLYPIHIKYDEKF